MIEQRDIENAKRLACALERHMDGVDLQRLASTLNYLPEQLQHDILSLARIVQEVFPSSDGCRRHLRRLRGTQSEEVLR